MHRQRLKAMLEKAELRMYEGAWRFARQKERIAEMSRRVADMRPFWEVLAQFEETQRLQMDHVQRLKKELYDPPGGEGEGQPGDVNVSPSYTSTLSTAGLTGADGGDEAAPPPPPPPPPPPSAERLIQGGDADADRPDGSFHHPHD